MIRLLLRFIGLIVLALAFIFLIYDGMRSIADRTFYATPLNQFWTDVHGASLQAFKATVVGRLGDSVWQYAIQPVLDQPAVAVFVVLGALLIVLGRKKRPLIGYARD